MPGPSRERVEALFDQARRLPPGERAAYLDTQCADDDGLRADVESLLRYDAMTGSFLDEPATPEGATTAEHKPSAGPGDETPPRLDRYRVLGRLGEGGMGVVYLAQQMAPVRRRVALKVIRPGFDTREVLARFEAERQALALMNHPGIAQVHDAGVTEDGRPYFAMEHVAGEPITRHADQRKLPTRERLELFMAVCDAVQHAHQKGVIHRDLKPSNVLVQDLDGRAAPKVIDFGIAKATQQPLTDRTLFTSSGQLLGTPEYMSPEQAESGGMNVDTRTDIYALGVILYELLTGTLPFEASAMRSKGLAEVQRILRDEEPPKPSTRISGGAGPTGQIAERRRTDADALRRQLRGDLDWITMRAMEKDRARRYATASELSAEVQRYLDDEPVLAGPPSTTYRVGKFVRRHRTAVGAGALVAAALVMGIIGTTWQALAAERSRVEAQTQADIAEAVNQFLNEDLLAAVAPSSDPGRGREVRMRDVLDAAAERIETAAAPGGRFVEKPRIVASIRRTLGSTYRQLGVYDEALHHLEESRRLFRRELGDEAAETLAATNDVGLVYWRQGRYADAERLFEELLETRQRAAGEEHPDTLGAMNNLALIYSRQGRHADAEALQRRAVELKTTSLGAEHPDTLTSANNLAIVLEEQGRYAEAEAIYEDTLAARRRVRGDEHPETLSTMNNLAVLYDDVKRYDDAVSMYGQVIEIRSRVLGPKHADTLDTRNNLGVVLRRMGRVDEAADQVEIAALGMRETLGLEHRWTLRCMHHLVALRVMQRRVDEARPLMRDVLETRLRRANAPDATAADKNRMAWDLLTCEVEDLREPARALELARAAATMTDHADPGVLDTLAIAWDANGDRTRAIDTQRRAIALVPKDDPARAELEATLARYRNGDIPLFPPETTEEAAQRR